MNDLYRGLCVYCEDSGVKYTLDACIGEGVSGNVYSCMHNGTVAIKVFSYEDDYEQETNVWKSIDDPCFLDVGTLESMDLPCIVLRRFDMSLHQLFRPRPLAILITNLGAGKNPTSAFHLRQVAASKMIASVLEELSCLHAKGWIHMDIKSPNIMLKSLDKASPVFLQVQLVDFGRSLRLDEESGHYWNHTSHEPIGGAYSCMPLEALHMIAHQYSRLPPTHMHRVGTKVDSFSVGVLLYTMIMQEYPNGIFPSERKYIPQIIDVLKKEAWKTKKNMSSLWPETRDFLSKAMAIEEEKRWTCTQLREHYFLTNQSVNIK